MLEGGKSSTCAVFGNSHLFKKLELSKEVIEESAAP
jgi:hypothetical protein